MDKLKRIRRVTIKTERTVVFTNRDTVRVVWCAECGAGVGMMCVRGAARAAGVNELAIYRLVDWRLLHYSEDSEGRVLVCLDSLRRHQFCLNSPLERNLGE